MKYARQKVGSTKNSLILLKRKDFYYHKMRDLKMDGVKLLEGVKKPEELLVKLGVANSERTII